MKQLYNVQIVYKSIWNFRIRAADESDAIEIARDFADNEPEHNTVYYDATATIMADQSQPADNEE